jgi:hypothetical protein
VGDESERDLGLLEVLEFQRAARRLVRASDLDPGAKCLAIVGLAERAATARLPEMARRAVWVEAAEFLETGQVREPPPSSDPVVIAIRALRRKGYARCPSCHLGLPDEATIQRWEARRFAEFVRLYYSDRIDQGAAS